MKYEQLIIGGENGKTLGYKSFKNRRWINGDRGFQN